MTIRYPAILLKLKPPALNRECHSRIVTAGNLPAATGFLLLLFLFLPGQASATQAHAAPEGLVVHQIAHIFFAVSMATLIYWLRKTGLAGSKGWRPIQWAAVLLILWNLDTLLVHFLDEQAGLVQIRQEDGWNLRIQARQGFAYLGWLYYLLKLDHLLLVPALGCLYLGLRRLTREQPEEGEPGRS